MYIVRSSFSFWACTEFIDKRAHEKEGVMNRVGHDR